MAPAVTRSATRTKIEETITGEFYVFEAQDADLVLLQEVLMLP